MKLLVVEINGYLEVIKIENSGKYNDVLSVKADTSKDDDISSSLIGKVVSLGDEQKLDVNGNPIIDTEGNPVLRKVAYEDATAQAAKNAGIIAEEAAKKKKSKYPNRYAYAIVIKSKIADINDTKGWDQAALQTYLADVTVKQINDLISDASFSTAKAILDSADLSAYYTIEEIGAISTLIGDYLVAEGV